MTSRASSASRIPRASLALTLAALLVAAACASEDDDGDAPAPAACATSVPALEPGVFPPDAIPKGACRAEGERCSLKVGYACANGGIGRVDSAQCTCREAAWSCALTNGGTSSCPTVPEDASADAAPE